MVNGDQCSGEVVISAVVISGEVVSAPRCVVTPRVIIAAAVSPLELQTNIHEALSCVFSEKAPTRAVSLLKVATTAFTFKTM